MITRIRRRPKTVLYKILWLYWYLFVPEGSARPRVRFNIITRIIIITCPNLNNTIRTHIASAYWLSRIKIHPTRCALSRSNNIIYLLMCIIVIYYVSDFLFSPSVHLPNYFVFGERAFRKISVKKHSELQVIWVDIEKKKTTNKNAYSNTSNIIWIFRRFVGNYTYNKTCWISHDLRTLILYHPDDAPYPMLVMDWVFCSFFTIDYSDTDNHRSYVIADIRTI